MLRRLRSRLTYANVMATLGVFIALGGTAYAVNTVGSSDIIDGQVKSVDVGDGEINSADVKDQSLTTFDVSTFLGADVVDGTLTGADIQDNSLAAGDIGSQQIGSDEVQNDSLLQSDIRAGAVTGDEVLDNSLTGADIGNGSLKGADVGQGQFVNFAADIGTIASGDCVFRSVTGINAQGDHLLLTPSDNDSGFVLYSLEYRTDAEQATLRACNPWPFEINDGTTHFNLLVIDAQ